MRPALWTGVFGVRPTHGRVSNQGMVPCVPYVNVKPCIRRLLLTVCYSALDTPSFLARSLEQCEQFAKVWYGDRVLEQIETVSLCIARSEQS